MDTSQDPARAKIEATATRSEIEGDIVRLWGGIEARQAEAVRDIASLSEQIMGDSEERARRLIDHLFLRGLQLVGVVFLAGFISVLALRRLKK